VRSGNGWSLTLTTPLALGTYAVAATVTDADGFTLSDATTNELVIGSAPGGTVTIGGSFQRERPGLRRHHRGDRIDRRPDAGRA
jgi:hypothetical protein